MNYIVWNCSVFKIPRNLAYGRLKPGTFFVSDQTTVFQGLSFFLPNDVTRHVIIVANHMIAVAYSRDRRCQRHLKEI